MKPIPSSAADEMCEALDPFNAARGSVGPDNRFYQLVDLALEGGADAVADLWREYEFQFGDEPYPASSTRPVVIT
jgi:hypothetical protein